MKDNPYICDAAGKIVVPSEHRHRIVQAVNSVEAARNLLATIHTMTKGQMSPEHRSTVHRLAAEGLQAFDAGQG